MPIFEIGFTVCVPRIMESAMPVFEFECKDCRKRFEILALVQRAKKEKEVVCPGCGSSEVVKQFSAFGVGGASGKPTKAAGDVGSGGCAPHGCECM